MWWQRGVIYQVYPRSFQDSDGDGVGDLRGIIRRLPHLVDLGVDAVWLSPIFKSPMADFGYDISDYTAIDPLFGTMADFDALLMAVHGHGLKLILDFVPNHTSDEHAWFQESRASRTNPKRDWYIWRDPAPDGGPPNNWMSEFGGSAWEFDETTGQYYYHAFLARQPDLNWRNLEVRHAMHEVMRFWLKKGVDGFRVDVIWHMIKDPDFRDNPPNPNYREGRPPHERVVPLYTADHPDVHQVISGLRRVVDEFPERLLIGEIYLPIERLVAYYGRDLDGAHLPFNFSLLDTPWHARTLDKLIHEYETALPPGGWPNWVLGNHDRPRITGRVGRDQARVAAMLLLTLRGTPTIYYGDEIGMHQVDIPPECVRDPFEKNCPGLGCGRDGCRTPMQWEAGRSAGFTEAAEPWLPLAEDHRSQNVNNQRVDRTSILQLYRRLLALRRRHDALSIGSYRRVMAEGDLLIYLRHAGRERFLITLNLSDQPAEVAFPGPGVRGIVRVSCFADRDGETVNGNVALHGNEGLVIELAPGSPAPPSEP
jgi:alpha-glucosidase